MAEEATTKENGANAEELGKQVMRTLDEISRLDVVRLNFRTLLDDEKVRNAHASEMQKMAAAIKVLRMIHDNPQEVYDSRDEIIAKLRREYGETHKFVELATKTIMNLPDLRELPAIVRILGWITREKFAKTAEQKNALARKLQELAEELKQFNDKEREDAIVKISHLIEGSEVGVIETFIEDTRHWMEWRKWGGGQQPVDFFIRRIAQYLLGGEGMKGLQKDFGDKRIAREILGNDAVKNLRTFKKQIELFDNIFNYLRQIIETKTWTADFKRLDGRVVKMPFLGKDGFHHNLSHGDNYIGIVETKFGNKEFARVLREFERRTHEQPEKWEEEFSKLERRLKDSKYEEEHVIMPAAHALEQIFMRRIEELKKDKDKRVEVQRRIIEKKKDELEHAGEKATREFSNEIKQRKKQIERMWKRVNFVFKRRENRYLVAYAEVLNNLGSLAKKYHLQEDLIEHGTDLVIRKGVLNQAMKTMNSLGEDMDEGGPGRLYFLMDSVIHRKGRDEQFFDQASELEEKYPRDLKSILKKSKKVLDMAKKLVNFVKKNEPRLGLEISEIERPIIGVSRPIGLAAA